MPIIQYSYVFMHVSVYEIFAQGSLYFFSFCNLYICTCINIKTITQVDDALSLERLEDGREKIWVHISDVSRLVLFSCYCYFYFHKYYYTNAFSTSIHFRFIHSSTPPLPPSFPSWIDGFAPALSYLWRQREE